MATRSPLPAGERQPQFGFVGSHTSQVIYLYVEEHTLPDGEARFGPAAENAVLEGRWHDIGRLMYTESEDDPTALLYLLVCTNRLTEAERGLLWSQLHRFTHTTWHDRPREDAIEGWGQYEYGTLLKGSE